MSNKNKSTKFIYEERVTIVTEMLLAGLSRREILGNIRKNEKLNWNVSDKQVDNYIAEANKVILAPLGKERDKLKSKVFSRYDFLYKKLVGIKDYRGAAIVTEKVCNLFGLNDNKDEETDDSSINNLVAAINRSRDNIAKQKENESDT